MAQKSPTSTYSLQFEEAPKEDGPPGPERKGEGKAVFRWGWGGSMGVGQSVSSAGTGIWSQNLQGCHSPSPEILVLRVKKSENSCRLIFLEDTPTSLAL